MKRIKVIEGQVAVVFKNGEVKEVLKKGLHWFFFNEDVCVYSIAEQFTTHYNSDILLRNKKFQDLVYVIDVKDDELYLMYDKGVFKKVLKEGTFIFWKEAEAYSFVRIDLSKVEITESVSKAVLVKLIALGVVREHVVDVSEVGVLFVDGEYKGELNSGSHYFWKNSQTVLARNVDMRNQRLEINGQEILTQDKANLRINLEAVYRVVDLDKAVLKTHEFEKQLYALIQLVVRSVIGAITFDELMSQKEELSIKMLTEITEKTISLGVEVKSLGIKDIVLPGDMKEIMNQVLVAQKKAQANVIMRREETASTRSMLNTAKLMEDNPMLFKLKEMEYVEKIAERIDSISVSGGGKVIGQLKEIFT